MTLHTGARLGPYEIVAFLGRGGMGEVYRAVDTRVARTVAIKVLPADAADQIDRRQRFEREAKAVARLNHPHICALYDVGQQDGIEFLVMEYLDGETLAARLTTGPLPLAEALAHAVALAQALARAHREGITHRDIKPSNVMLTEGGVKLLDFGLAKLRDAGDPARPRSPLDDQSTGDGLSPEGTLVGTIAYMSPEQLAGGAVDARTDIYALGLLVYEMITGQRAFAKGSQAGLIAAIMTEEPPAMTAVRPGTPAAVQRIVLTALEKDPNRRWQDAGDFARELAWAATDSHTTAVNTPPLSAPRLSRAWAVGAAVVAIVATIGTAGVLLNRPASIRNPQSTVRNLVVLPCAAKGDASAQAYCDGIAETLGARLASLTASGAIEVTSTLEVRRRGVTSPADARRVFGATLVVEGAIERAGDTLRITYSLVDTTTLAQIDALSTTAPAGDPFALQDRVSQWALDSLALKGGGAQSAALPETRVPRAFELYLVGRGYLLDYHVRGNIDRAIQLFAQSAELDPRYAAAYAGLGQAYWLNYDDTKDTAWVARARQACERAVSLPSQGAPAFVCLGTVEVGTGQYDAAAEAFQRALERDPSSDEAYLGLARAQEALGRTAEAEQTYRRAVTLRPGYWAAHTRLGAFFRNQGRYREAAVEFERAVGLTPDNAQAHLILGGLNVYLGNYDSAIASFRRSVELGPTTQAYSNWGMTYFRMRRFDEAIAELEAARNLEPTNYRALSNLARAYYWRGRRSEAKDACAAVLRIGREQLQVNPRNTDVHLLMAECFARNGDADNARRSLHLSEVTLDTEPHAVLFVAMIHNQLGARADALAWLRRSVANGLPAAELRSWIEIDNLRGDPGFPAPLVSR